MAKVFFNFNFKGGVGKTSLSVIESYQLAEQMNKKVLFLDLDAQASATNFIELTYKTKAEPKVPLHDSLVNGNLNQSIVKMSNNFDLLPADWSMSLFNQDVEKLDRRKRNLILANELELIKGNYDFVFIDTPPSLSTLVNNAVLAADFVTIILQTQQSSYLSSLKTVQYLEQLRADYKAPFSLIGVVLYLMQVRGVVDRKIATTAKAYFHNAIYANQIYNRERVKRWGNQGITADKTDSWDIKTHRMYKLVLMEALRRAGLI